ncbi:unnamed protein product [Tenebrio molitor]|nr:unnamed protein product [Tenebrio molitor]
MDQDNFLHKRSKRGTRIDKTRRRKYRHTIKTRTNQNHKDQKKKKKNRRRHHGTSLFFPL